MHSETIKILSFSDIVKRMGGSNSDAEDIEIPQDPGTCKSCLSMFRENIEQYRQNTYQACCYSSGLLVTDRESGIVDDFLREGATATRYVITETPHIIRVLPMLEQNDFWGHNQLPPEKGYCALYDNEEGMITILKDGEPVYEEDAKKVPQQYVIRYADIKCPMLDDNNGCRIYDRRPLTCRLYPLTEKDGMPMVDYCPLSRGMDNERKERIKNHPVAQVYAWLVKNIVESDNY